MIKPKATSKHHVFFGFDGMIVKDTTDEMLSF